MMRIGVDTGGTFTDLVLLDGRELFVHKVRSTPDDPSRAILAGIREILALRTGAPGAEAPIAPGLDVVHGSTVATNAVLERRGARVGLVATRGFEDVLRIGRQTRKELYNFLVPDRAPLVDEGMTFGVAERMLADGSVRQALDASTLDGLVASLRTGGAASVAVCLLHSYANPAHERAIAERLAAEGFSVSASHVILPEYREFERWSTTVVNAYVTPLMDRYLGRLQEALHDTRLSIMQSNGGSISATQARTAAVQTILSGPAAGAVGAHAVAHAAGFPRVISFDMGGTSTDVSLIDDRIGVTTESTVGDFPVRLPIIDIHTVGAGGGSIAFIDPGGALRVGPRSAGADPGPICYGRGTELTVTDANLLLGRLDPGAFLGGRMSLDARGARAAARAMGRTLGMSDMQLAHGIVRIANANMERAIRVVSVQRGFDPRDFALLAFGGAGGMHACEIADTLDITTVIVPRHAGVLSALGMLLADVTKDYSQSVLTRVDLAADAWLDAQFAPLVARANADLAREGFDERRRVIACMLDVRYVGQSFEISVPLAPGYRETFDAQHARLYGYSNAARPAEIVNVRVKASGVTDKPALPRATSAEPAAPVPVTLRPAWFAGRRVETAVFRTEALAAGEAAMGPAILAGGQATTVIPPNFRFRVDALGNVIASRVSSGGRRRATKAAPAAVPVS